MVYLKAYFGFLFAFLALDVVWIKLVASKIYAADVAHLLADSPNLAAAVVFYLLYFSGVVYFAIRPALDRSTGFAVVQGGLLGAYAYGTYTFTNYALMDGWTATIAVTDVAWGAVITGVSAGVAHLAATRL